MTLRDTNWLSVHGRNTQQLQQQQQQQQQRKPKRTSTPTTKKRLAGDAPALKQTDFKRQRVLLESFALSSSSSSSLSNSSAAAGDCKPALPNTTVFLQSKSNAPTDPFSSSTDRVPSYLDAAAKKRRNPFELLTPLSQDADDDGNGTAGRADDTVDVVVVFSQPGSQQPKPVTAPESDSQMSALLLPEHHLSVRDGDDSGGDVDSDNEEDVDGWADARMDESDGERLADDDDDNVWPVQDETMRDVTPTTAPPSAPTAFTEQPRQQQQQATWSIMSSAVITSSTPVFSAAELASTLPALQALHGKPATSMLGELQQHLLVYVYPDRPIPSASVQSLSSILAKGQPDTLRVAEKAERQWYLDLEAHWKEAFRSLAEGAMAGLVDCFYYAHENHFAAVVTRVSVDTPTLLPGVQVVINKSTVGLRAMLDTQGIKYSLPLYEQRRPKVVSRDYVVAGEGEGDAEMDGQQPPVSALLRDKAPESALVVSDPPSVAKVLDFLARFTDWNASGVASLDIQLPTLVCPRPFLRCSMRQPQIKQWDSVQVVASSAKRQVCKVQIDSFLLPRGIAALQREFGTLVAVGAGQSDFSVRGQQQTLAEAVEHAALTVFFEDNKNCCDYSALACAGALLDALVEHCTTTASAVKRERAHDDTATKPRCRRRKVVEFSHDDELADFEAWKAQNAAWLLQLDTRGKTSSREAVSSSLTGGGGSAPGNDDDGGQVATDSEPDTNAIPETQ
ncbi:hypothetical protein RI367_002511 [Sorochytrium milnesiophthora]